jgi:hypothetical protein
MVPMPHSRCHAERIARLGNDSYPAMQLGDLEIRPGRQLPLVIFDRPAASQSAQRCSIGGRSGILDHSGTTSLAWQWLEMETGEHGAAPQSWSGQTSGQPSAPSVRRGQRSDATPLTRDSDCLGSALLLDDLVALHPQVQLWSAIRSLWTITRIETYVESVNSRALDLILDPSNGGHMARATSRISGHG